MQRMAHEASEWASRESIVPFPGKCNRFNWLMIFTFCPSSASPLKQEQRPGGATAVPVPEKEGCVLSMAEQEDGGVCVPVGITTSWMLPPDFLIC